MQKNIQTLAVLAAAGLMVGCHRDEIRVYEVPKDGAAPAVATAAAPLPEGWQPKPPTDMRLASYAVRGANGVEADVGIIRLPGTGGKEIDTVNRWRSAVGQKGLADEDLAKQVQPVTIGGVSGKLYEAAGASPENDEPTRILGAMVERDGIGWFFKMIGNDKLVASQKQAFLAFLKAYNFEAPRGGHEVTSAATDPHAGLNIAAGGAAEEPPTAQPTSWPVPPSWKQQPPKQFQTARFSVAGGSAEVTLSQAGGSLAMNVNRWRGQVGLPEVSASEAEKLATPLDLGGAQARLVDLPGDTKRMVVIIVPNGQGSTFYKLMGDPSAVKAERDALIEFAKKTK